MDLNENGSLPRRIYPSLTLLNRPNVIWNDYSTVKLFRDQIFFNPTKLPDWATDVLFEVENDFSANISNGFYDRLLWCREHLAGLGYHLPVFHEMFNACEKGQLKELLLQNVNPNLYVSKFSKHHDPNLGVIHQKIPSLNHDV